MITDSGLIINNFYSYECKSYQVKSSFIPAYATVLSIPIITTAKETKTKFITVHGNVLYNFFYRSQIDTPFAESNVMQHQVQTNLSLLIKDKYPLHVIISNRSSNSAYFKNATDVNVQFNRSYLLEKMKADLKVRATSLIKTDKLNTAEQELKAKSLQLNQLKNWVNSPSRMQELVEERERKLRGNNLGEIDTINKRLPGDSNLLSKYTAKKEQVEVLEKEFKQAAAKLNQEKKNVLDSINKIKQEINNLKSGPGLYAFMKKRGMSDKELTKGQKLLLSINQIGIGRTWVDYSELTVKNISVGGINVEMNPLPFYFAFAAGKVNYSFRDFIIKGNNALPDQSLYLIRAGLGQKEKSNLVFTFYNGKKSVLNYTPSNTPNSVQRVLGISAEARLALNENNYLIAEVAKSSFQDAGVQPTSAELVHKALDLKIHSNEAYSIKLFSQYPQTDTKFTGYYKKYGSNFQSFNLYPVNISQDAYMLKLNQYFWKRKLSVDAAIKKNDFNSPIAAPSFSSQTIFKSIQASVRVKKLPFVSVGYYPSSQLSLSNNNLLIENQYNTLNAVMNYSYQVKKMGMNTNIIYTKFYNSSSDTGFIYFNASNYTINQSFFITPFVLQGNVSMTDQKNIHLVTIEPQVSYQYKNIVTLSGSFKWNRLNYAVNMFGGTAAISLYLKKLGTIQLNYDKTYIPAANTTLRPVDIGRASFYREF